MGHKENGMRIARPIGVLAGVLGLLAGLPATLCLAGDAASTLRRHVVAVLGPPGTGACTGVIIDRQRVLTAAHCLVAAAAGYRVEMIGPDGAVVAVAVASHRRHPGFSRAALEQDGNAHDVAVLTLKDPLPADALPARLAGPGDLSGEVFAVGMEGGLFASIANRVRVMRLAVAGGETGRMMLEPTAGGGGQPCHGDSGGPVFRKSGSGYALVAIISWGTRRCDGETAATIVSAYKPFIRS
jgi:secreted trypsin-like serine protease